MNCASQIVRIAKRRNKSISSTYRRLLPRKPLLVVVKGDVHEEEILQECFQVFDQDDLKNLMHLIEAGHDLAYAIEHYEEVDAEETCMTDCHINGHSAHDQKSRVS